MTLKNKTKLKPCPFCGGGRDEESTIKAWNTRAPLPNIKGLKDAIILGKNMVGV